MRNWNKRNAYTVQTLAKVITRNKKYSRNTVDLLINLGYFLYVTDEDGYRWFPKMWNSHRIHKFLYQHKKRRHDLLLQISDKPGPRGGCYTRTGVRTRSKP